MIDPSEHDFDKWPAHAPAERYWEARWRDEKAENERLTAALADVVTTDPPPTSDDWFQEWKNLAFKLKGIARRALEGK